MERKDYAERIMNVKNDILNEIRNILGYGCKHDFTKTFFVHYVEGDTATTEECTAVETDNDGMVIFHVNNVAQETEKIEGETIFAYDPESFLDILDHLQKEVREKKLSHLREIVKRNGGRIKFDGTFATRLSINGETLSVGVESLYIDEDDCFCIENHHHHCSYSDQCESLLSDDLDKLIAYVESKTNQKFVIRVSGSYSRTFDIEASSYEEALEFAKTEWKEDAPLCPDDSNGENWEDYTSVAH
jgi:hypothetical protein